MTNGNGDEMIQNQRILGKPSSFHHQQIRVKIQAAYFRWPAARPMHCRLQPEPKCEDSHGRDPGCGQLSTTCGPGPKMIPEKRNRCCEGCLCHVDPVTITKILICKTKVT